MIMLKNENKPKKSENKKERLFGKKMAVNKNNFNLLEFVLF